MRHDSLSLLEGAVDLHVHGYPELALSFPTFTDDVEALELARDYGMRGLVFKSHMMPTSSKAFYLQQRVPEVTAYSSITLNTVCGGLDPVVVEHAAMMGAKVVHMPTWSSQYDMKVDNSIPLFKKWIPSMDLIDRSSGLTVLDADGNLRSSVKTIMQMAKDYGLAVFTGHLSPDENFSLFQYARDIDYLKVVWCHPVLFGISDHDLMRAGSMGAYVELTGGSIISCFQSTHPKRLVELIELLGSEHVVVTTDHFHESSPSPAEMLRMFASTLLAMGVSQRDIRRMIVDNPYALLGIE